jgi:hypothetical protein
MSKLESELKAVRARAAALSSGQRVQLGGRQTVAGLSNLTRGSAGLSVAGVRKSLLGASVAARGAGGAAVAGAKKAADRARSKEAELAADARKVSAVYRDRATDVFPVQITNPTIVEALEKAGLADALPAQLATTKSTSRRRLRIALLVAAVIGAGAAAFAISRRTRPQPPSVAAAPPRLSDVPVVDTDTDSDGAEALDPAGQSTNGQSAS